MMSSRFTLTSTGCCLMVVTYAAVTFGCSKLKLKYNHFLIFCFEGARLTYRLTEMTLINSFYSFYLRF